MHSHTQTHIHTHTLAHSLSISFFHLQQVHRPHKTASTGRGHRMAFTVNLNGPSPWGFRISGGRDFKKAITVSKVIASSFFIHSSIPHLFVSSFIERAVIQCHINGSITYDLTGVRNGVGIQLYPQTLRCLCLPVATCFPGYSSQSWGS